ncbi:unnamed protein product [Lymnaea stagnalis]|uniref:Carbohydrate deacetylase n=1 Tax=Lymnaea stagnalis TaxID=6523 RepID=A0AAV2HPY5_LYMST
MKRFLIITADDFGFSTERNQGVLEAFNNGAVKSASLLLNCTGTNEAANIFKTTDLCPGLHLNLTEGTPIGIENYKTLIAPTNGIFKGKFELRKQLDSDLINPLEIRQEIDCQIKLFKELIGRDPVYVDGHQHIHLHPNVAEIFADALNRHNIKVTRLPIEINMASKDWVNPEYMPFFIKMIENVNKTKVILDQYGVKSTDSFTGLSTMGRDMTADRLKKIILEAFEDAEKRMAARELYQQQDFTTCELMSHPGHPTDPEYGGFSWGSDDFGCSDDRIHEINVLSSAEMMEFYKANNIQLVSHKILDN